VAEALLGDEQEVVEEKHLQAVGRLAPLLDAAKLALLLEHAGRVQ
jgi:hypothetical protein